MLILIKLKYKFSYASARIKYKCLKKQILAENEVSQKQ